MKQSSGRSDAIIESFLSENSSTGLAILDSCGVGDSGRNRLFLASDPAQIHWLQGKSPTETLGVLDLVSALRRPAVFTLSYDFGNRLQGIQSRHSPDAIEPDLYCAVYDSAVLYDYDTDAVKILGSGKSEKKPIEIPLCNSGPRLARIKAPANVTAIPPRDVYLSQIEVIKELIRSGETYQANLTRRISVQFDEDPSPAGIFFHGRSVHPAAFAALIDRGESAVVSLSPERFFSIRGRRITASPIKGTRRRSADAGSDWKIVNDLSTSVKDRAENIMIVDLLRNDLGRICKFGSIKAGPLLQVEAMPSLFHLVSHISGTLNDPVSLSGVFASLFPCGSITGAPKLNTMKILDAIETVPRGLSMGAIGLILPSDKGQTPDVDVSVAIRTLVLRGRIGTFNVGGGIVIDSKPESEFDETETKAAALLAACGA